MPHSVGNAWRLEIAAIRRTEGAVGEGQALKTNRGCEEWSGAAHTAALTSGVIKW
jgi:hypothetical protein